MLYHAASEAREIQVKKLVHDRGGKEEIHVKGEKGDAEPEAERYCQVVLLCG